LKARIWIAWTLCWSLSACERPTPVWIPSDTREERGPFPILFVGTLSGPQAERAQSALLVVREQLQRIEQQGGIRGRKVDLHVVDDQGQLEHTLSALQRLGREWHAPAAFVVSQASAVPPDAALACQVVGPDASVPAAWKQLVQALERAKHLTPQDVRAALVGSAP
jgi:hypothetical protein